MKFQLNRKYVALLLNQNIELMLSDLIYLTKSLVVIQGVRRLGSAAADMSHVALGIAEAYWEYRLKPWDMAAGVLVHICCFQTL